VTDNEVYDNGSNGVAVNGSRNTIANNRVLRKGQSAAFGEWDRSGIFIEAIGDNAVLAGTTTSVVSVEVMEMPVPVQFLVAIT
jgi:hypothetical protein